MLGYSNVRVDTTISYGPSASSKYITTYFTKAFSVADASAVGSMLASVLYDDGFVVYLNGTEVARASMPGGTVTGSTLAFGHDSGAGYETFDWSSARGLLRDGSNVLAVEVHQVAASSSDLVFDLELVLGGGGGGGGATAGFPAGSAWRWYYAAASPTTSTTWSSPLYDDASWATGASPLGYGESYIATPLPFSNASTKPIAAYFRRTFQVGDPALVTRITGRMRYDDGVVVWINGVEAGRSFMPTGTFSHTTPGHDHEAVSYETFDWSARRSALVSGTNVIAVEVHQTGPASSDLVFDLELTVE